jgi:hypothetical protein
MFINQLISINTVPSNNLIPLCSEIDRILYTISSTLSSYHAHFNSPELIMKTFSTFKALNIKSTLEFSAVA